MNGKVFKHFKGNYYLVLSVGRCSETLKELVTYKSLKDGEVWTRCLDNFNETLKSNGKVIKRFTPIEELMSVKHFSTEELLEELFSREDYPFRNSADEVNKTLLRTDYLVAEILSLTGEDDDGIPITFKDFNVSSVHNTLDAAKSFLENSSGGIFINDSIIRRCYFKETV